MFDTLTLTTDPRGIATLLLNRPDRHNAMSAAMIADLTAAAARIAADDGIRAVILTGAGDSFCAGADLGWMQDQMAADSATRAAGARRLALMLRALNDLPKPLVGRVNGPAYGGGLGLIAVCDVAVAADTAVFAFSETRLGIIPATIGPYVTARMGEARAREVFFSARRFAAPEAVRLGLIARTATDLDAATEAEVTPYLATAPAAVARAKALVRSLGPAIDDTVIDRTATALVKAWESPEAQEGITAFFERRKPGWQV
jgi:methylglutaconyl-CoA hydratase